MAGEGASTVLVGCKMPGGVVLNLDRYVNVGTDQMPVIRTETSKLVPVTLRGNAFRQGHEPDQSNHGYMFTPVPKDFWDEWIKRNAECSLVLDGFVMGPANSVQGATGMAREREGERGQFPRLTEKDPRTRDLGIRDAEEMGNRRRAA